MAQITFLRHAQTEFNKLDLFCGVSDCDITAEGAKLAKSLRDNLPQFDYYYCSPLKRTSQTLRAIFPDAVPIIDNRITEISLGIWEGQHKHSVNQDERRAFKKGHFTPNGAENPRMVEERAKSFLADIFSIYTGNERILVVTHNGFIRTLARLLDIPPINKNLEFFTIDSDNFANFV